METVHSVLTTVGWRPSGVNSSSGMLPLQKWLVRKSLLFQNLFICRKQKWGQLTLNITKIHKKVSLLAIKRHHITQHQRPKSPMATLTWYVSKNNFTRYINSTKGISFRFSLKLDFIRSFTSPVQRILGKYWSGTCWLNQVTCNNKSKNNKIRKLHKHHWRPACLKELARTTSRKCGHVHSTTPATPAISHKRFFQQINFLPPPPPPPPFFPPFFLS